ncbi:peroxisomal N(1)-acetyl-spermine/spermidine oxidase-like [Clytia hemisphaerica]|uniref:Amine oxidase domain-containing protein n=1 Tax=Clytia hemisphaerica TaxID=252671 RepID=A0A7M5X7M3_9CNID
MENCTSAKKSVVIIGAGICGLACARELSKFEETIDLSVLEASDRIGGRIRSVVTQDGVSLELGAHYIHGTVGNPVFDFAVEKGIVGEAEDPLDWNSPQIFRCFDKELETSAQIKQKATEKATTFRETMMERLVEGQDAEAKHFNNVGEFWESKINTFKSSQPIEEVNALECVFNNLAIEECSYNGCERLEQLDLQTFVVYDELPGNRSFKPVTGYSKVIEALNDELENDVVKLQHRVCNVVKNMRNRYEVVCENGARFEADIVVVTVSVNVLKSILQNENFFKPPLPVQKTKALEKIKLSNVVKIYFKFKDPFPKKETNLMLFCPTGGTMRESAFGWIHEIERIGDSNWWMLWVVGELIETLKKSDSIQTFLLDVLRNIKNQYPEFPQQVKIDTNNVLTYDWASDPYYQGGYSYFETGGRIEEIVPILRKHVIHGDEGQNQCRLIISGEITHQQFYSTTHAGFTAGIRDGKEIAKIFNI